MHENGDPAIDAAAVHRLDPAWLRDNCQCIVCRDPASGANACGRSSAASSVGMTTETGLCS